MSFLDIKWPKATDRKPTILMKDGILIKEKILVSGFPTLLINDGKVVEENLTKLGYDKEWLKNELLKKGISNINDVYAAMIDHSRDLYYSVKTKKNISIKREEL